MKEAQSLTVCQDLVLRLKDMICCSETHEICSDNGFCGSDPATWPSVPNGVPKTRLTYPEDDDKPSIPDVPGFCAQYTSWYTRTNCGALAKDIARGISSAGSCPQGADVDQYISRILRGVPWKQRKEAERILRDQVMGPAQQQCEKFEQSLKAMQETLAARCEILYEKDASGMMRFNEERAEGLKNIASFCRQVEEEEAAKINWKSFGGGGAATAGGAGLIYYISRILKALKGVKDIDESTVGAARGIRRFFSFSLPNLGRALGYAFSLKWIRGEKPPKELPDPTAPKGGGARQQKIEIHVHQNGQVTNGHDAAAPNLSELISGEGAEKVVPTLEMVLAQFGNLTQSKRYSKEGERFAGLSEVAGRYMASLVIDRWGRESIETRQLFAKDDSRPLHGKIPIGYLLKFARKYLKPEMLGLIEVSAKGWAETGELGEKSILESAAAKEFNPNVDQVYRQLVHDDRYTKADGTVQEYLARKAIAQWEELSPQGKASFVTSKDRPDSGALPNNFVRFFRKKMMAHPHTLGRRAVVFLQLLHEVPEFAGISFSIIDRRAELVEGAWDKLSEGVKQAFWMQDGFSRLPHEPNELPSTFIQHMKPALQVGVLPRQTLLPLNEPWKPEDSPPFPYRGFDLRVVMKSIIALDGRAAYYPTQLGQRARAIVESWISLTPGIRARFLEDGQKDPEEVKAMLGGTTIPERFVDLWYFSSPGIGIGSRDPASEAEETVATAPEGIGADPVKKGFGDTVIAEKGPAGENEISRQALENDYEMVIKAKAAKSGDGKTSAAQAIGAANVAATQKPVVK